MINLELNSKVRISIPLLAIAGAYVAVRILKERGTKLPALDELTSKIKSFVGSTSILNGFTGTRDVHAAIAMALVDSGLITERSGVGGRRTSVKSRNQNHSAWSSKVHTLRRNPGQD